MTSKDELLAAFSGGPVAIEADGKSLQLRPLDPADVRECREWQKTHGDDRAYQMLFVRSVVAPDGARLFSDEEAAAVDRMPFTFVNAVVDEVMKLNRMGDYAKKAPSAGTTN